LVRNCQ